jgi:hypothetical protein
MTCPVAQRSTKHMTTELPGAPNSCKTRSTVSLPAAVHGARSALL